MNNIEMLEDYIEALRKPKPFKYTNEQKAEAIENLIQENKELKEKNEEYKNMIINHKKQLKQSGIYGYDYDLKILKEE